MDFSRFEPSKALRNLRTDIDALFDRFVEKPLGVITGQVVPPLDIAETDTEILVRMDLPGVDEKDIEVSVQNDTLTIRGQKKESRDEPGKTWHVVERPMGPFTRTVRLPVQVRVDMVRATFKKGVLDVELPKKELAQARKIEIRTEGE